MQLMPAGNPIPAAETTDGKLEQWRGATFSKNNQDLLFHGFRAAL